MKYLIGDNSKLKSLHLLFFIFLLVLLIAPKMLLSEGRTSFNLSFVILLLWLCYFMFQNPRFNLKNIQSINLFILFAFHFLITSLVSFKVVAILNSFQYLFYVISFSILFNNYLNLVDKANDFLITIRIINFVGIVYSLGSIASIFTGPIYPEQVGDTMRLWGGLRIQQGVGFGVNQNSVGGILVLFFIFCNFYFCSKYKNVCLLIYLIAIISTISRSAYLSLILSWLIFKLVFILKNFKKINIIVNKIFILNLIIFNLFILFFLNSKSEYYEAFKIGFGLSDIKLENSEESRFNQWIMGILNWKDSDIFHLLFGKGFKNSSEISDGKYISSHNLYIQYLLDSGLVGFLLFSLSIALFYLNLLKKIFNLTNDKTYFYCLYSISIILIHNISETFLYGIEYVIFLLLIFTIYKYPKLIYPNLLITNNSLIK